jgi:uncharacterized protein YqgC (DUF456 family)
MIKAVQYGLGISFIILGIAGLFLPFIQGILFIVIGVLIIKAPSMAHAWERIKEKTGLKSNK